MKTTRRTLAKLANGRPPSARMLARFAKANGLKISFEPAREKRRKG
jgi:hypothetical protein